MRGKVGAEVNDHGGSGGKMWRGEEDAGANESIEATTSGDAVERGAGRGVVDLVWRG